MNLQRNHRPPVKSAGLGLVAVTLALNLSACGGGADSEPGAQTAAAQARIASSRSVGSTATPTPQPSNTEGRLLASNCFQCHDTLGTGGFDRIRGSEANEVLEFLTKTASRDIMAAHAQGYTPEQLRQIIAYLQQ